MATKIPPAIRWKADNFNHLHEQPTVFYAVALGLAVIGMCVSLCVCLFTGYIYIYIYMLGFVHVFGVRLGDRWMDGWMCGYVDVADRHRRR